MIKRIGPVQLSPALSNAERKAAEHAHRSIIYLSTVLPCVLGTAKALATPSSGKQQEGEMWAARVKVGASADSRGLAWL